MQHPYLVLEPEYAKLLSTMKVTRRAAVDETARKLIQPKIIDRHLEVQRTTGVPAGFLACLFEREASSDFSKALGQGDPWNRKSVNVPRGYGPFKNWYEAAIFYVKYDKLDVFSAPLSIPYLCWKGEGYNGFGPRAHGRRSGYLWAGTNHYDPPTGLGGKYVSDGKWSGSTVDKQLGIVPVGLRMIELMPELAEGFKTVSVPAKDVPMVPVPVGVGGGKRDAEWIQNTLNKIGERPPLLVDGNYGRMTRAAVRRFQSAHGLEQDGLVGPLTVAALEKAIA